MNCNVWAVTSKRGVVYISCVAGKRLISATLACLFGLWIYLFTAYKLLLSWHQAIAERYLWVKEFITQVINLYIIGAVPVVYIWHSRMAFFSKVMRLLEQFVRLRHFRAVQCVQLYLLIFKFWKTKQFCFPGWVRQHEAVMLPRHRHLSGLFQRRSTNVLMEHPGQMAARNKKTPA